jgi:hypothetical protein
MACNRPIYAHAFHEPSLIVFSNRVGAEIKIHQDNLVQTARKGFQGEIDGEDQWTFAGSFLYSLTVITTIGE